MFLIVCVLCLFDFLICCYWLFVSGDIARVILHEYDHMLGANFTMRVSKLKLERAFKALEKKIKKHQRRMKHTRLT